MALQRLRIHCIDALASGIGLIAFSAAPAARAAPNGSGVEADCKAAYAASQERERAGSLREARDALVGCAKTECGKALRQQCELQYNRLDSMVPTVVLRFTDKSGARREDVQVRMDGQPFASKLDGQPLPVNPGVHEFTFVTADGQQATSKVMIVEGQLHRPIDVGLAPPVAATPSGQAPASQPAAAPKEGAPPVPPVGEEPEAPLPAGSPGLPFAIGGAGLVVAGGGVALLLAGKQNTVGLAVDAIGVGAGGIIGALWLLGRPHPHEVEKKASARVTYKVDVVPTTSGGVASMSGTF
jgi:hypothetical protein